MDIPDNLLIDLLKDFADLDRMGQVVFIFCLSNCPYPRLYSSDVAGIAKSVGTSRRTVQRKLSAIRQTRVLSRCVKVVKARQKELLKMEAENNAT